MKRAKEVIRLSKLRGDLDIANATIKDLLEVVREATARQKVLDSLEKVSSTATIKPMHKRGNAREMCGVALASDWHVEESVSLESTAGLNEYSLKIADIRIKRFFSAIAWAYYHHRGSGQMDLRSLVLWLGGDLITGYIHEELMESNALSPTMACMWLLRRLRNGIAFLLEHLGLEKLLIPCSVGNHGRTNKERRVSTNYANSYEFMVYVTLKEMFTDDPRVEFVIPKSNHTYVEVFDQTLHFHHGDELRYAGGVGGLAIPLGKRVPAWDRVRKADYHHVGHFHCLRDFGRAVVNGSLIGYGAYSMSIGADPEPPQQAFYLLDSKRGKSMVTPLWCGDK